MSAHFDGGDVISTRRLREVEVAFVHDPTLDLGAREDDSDECPPTPPPTYYVKVGGLSELSPEASRNTEWDWRYVDVEQQLLRVLTRRGGVLLHTVHLSRIQLLRIIPEPEELSDTLQIHVSSAVGSVEATAKASGANFAPSPPSAAAATTASAPIADVDSAPPATTPAPLTADTTPDTAGVAASAAAAAASAENAAAAAGAAPPAGGQPSYVLTLQARSRRETLLWGEVLKENIEQLVGKVVVLEKVGGGGRDGDGGGGEGGDAEKLALLLTHQLSRVAKEQQQPGTAA